MKKLILTAIVFALLILGISGFTILRAHQTDDRTGDYAVRLNEIEQLARSGDSVKAADCAAGLRRDLRAEETKSDDSAILLMCGACLLFLTGTVVYCGYAVAAPFHRLTGFAERVACGDLDTPLKYGRSNLFGKFTWAFDSMRQEIRRARACEQEAIENNKTVIASLSHDIKTPVSSIRAYAEALELGMDSAPDKRAHYIATILRKCDEVSQLTDDMLTHALTELERLRIVPERFDLCAVLPDILADLSAGQDDITCEKPDTPVYLNADKSRTEQLIGNLINNARKYAKTKITVSVKQEADNVLLQVRDYGSGIPDSELPFVCGKFYRGNAAKSEKGAGLGLYIVQYIAEQSGGSVRLQNCDPGLAVTVTLPAADANAQSS